MSDGTREYWAAIVYDNAIALYETKEEALKYAWMNSTDNVFKVREVLEDAPKVDEE